MKNIPTILSLIIIALCFALIIQNRMLKSKIDALDLLISKSKDHNSSDSSNLFNGIKGKIDQNVAKLMVKKFVSDMKDQNIARSVYFYNSSFKEFINNLILKFGESFNADIGLKIYFGKYYDNTDIKIYLKNYLNTMDDSVINQFLDENKNNVTAILAITKTNGEIDLKKGLLNLGGLCPPKCEPGCYNSKCDPLYHDIQTTDNCDKDCQ